MKYCASGFAQWWWLIHNYVLCARVPWVYFFNWTGANYSVNGGASILVHIALCNSLITLHYFLSTLCQQVLFLLLLCGLDLDPALTQLLISNTVCKCCQWSASFSGRSRRWLVTRKACDAACYQCLYRYALQKAWKSPSQALCNDIAVVSVGYVYILIISFFSASHAKWMFLRRQKVSVIIMENAIP